MINDCDISYKTLGEIIKYLRKRNKYSRRELAEMLGVSPTTISNYESDRRCPDLDTLSAMSLVFNVSMNLIMKAYDNYDKSKSILDM